MNEINNFHSSSLDIIRNWIVVFVLEWFFFYAKLNVLSSVPVGEVMMLTVEKSDTRTKYPSNASNDGLSKVTL